MLGLTHSFKLHRGHLPKMTASNAAVTKMYVNGIYESVAAGRDLWSANSQKVQHVGTLGEFIC